jgi:DNA-binding XRE family transcriptional regulator
LVATPRTHVPFLIFCGSSPHPPPPQNGKGNGRGCKGTIEIYHTIVILNNKSKICGVDTPTKRLGKNIKRIREQKNMSQGDVCRATGLDRAQVSNIESGNGNPTLATIERLAGALGVTSDELLK